MTQPFWAQPVRGGDIALWVQGAGSGPPVLFLSGLGYAGWCWQDVIARMSRTANAFTVDNRGSGRSDKPIGPYSMELMADDTKAVLDGLGIAQAHIVGHSMGGYIAQHLAIRHPHKVSSLVLIASSCGGPRAINVPASVLAAWQNAAGSTPEEFARRTMPLSFRPGWTLDHVAAFERYLRARLEFPTPSGNWYAQFDAAARHLLIGVDLRRIPHRTLVLHGTADGIVPYDNAHLFETGLANCKLHRLDGFGHLPFLEDCDLFCELLQAHLDEAPEARGSVQP
ncbi:MAG: alpha/beta fold hydrolase [Kofleriaceae bacterium]